MLNNTEIVDNSRTTNEVTFNSVAGTLVKSNEGSRIVQFKSGSVLAKTIFDEKHPHRLETGYKEIRNSIKKIPVTVLQVMLCGSDMYLIEYIDNLEG